MAELRVLGIDPGYDRCGYAVICCTAQGRSMRLLGSGTLRTSRTDTLPQRLCELGRQLVTVLERWCPDEVAVEQLYHSRNAKTVIQVAQARGVILERSAAAGLLVAEYSPTQVKSQLTGNGRAEKEQVAYMAARLVGSALPRSADSLSAQERAGGARSESSTKTPVQLDDEMDAIAVALCHGMRLSIPAALVGRPSVAASVGVERAGGPRSEDSGADSLSAHGRAGGPLPGSDGSQR